MCYTLILEGIVVAKFRLINKAVPMYYTLIAGWDEIEQKNVDYGKMIIKLIIIIISIIMIEVEMVL